MAGTRIAAIAVCTIMMLSGCISIFNGGKDANPEKIDVEKILDDFEMFRYADNYSPVPIANNIPGADAYQTSCSPRALCVFGANMETHFKKNDTIWAGLPAVNYNYNRWPVTSAGNPLGAVFAVVDGAEVQASADWPSFENAVEFFPHCFKTTVSSGGVLFETTTTFGNDKTFLVRATITNEDSTPHKIAPGIFGKTESGLFASGASEDGLVRLTVPFHSEEGIFPAIAPVFHGLEYVIRPDFRISESVLDNGMGIPIGASVANPLSYKIYGDALDLAPGEKMTYSYAVALDADTIPYAAAEDALKDQFDARLKRAWNFFGEQFNNLDLPEGISEERAKYCYGTIWALMHNLYQPDGQLSHPIIRPAVSYYDAIWNWDTPFHLVALSRFNPELAKDQVRQLLALQNAALQAGFISTSYGTAWQEIASQPPILIWGVDVLWERTGDNAFISEVYDGLALYYNWWIGNRDMNQNGLIEYNTQLETGWDTSPRWGLMGTNPSIEGGMPIEAIDLNCYMYVGALALSDMAAELGKTQDALDFKQKVDALAEKINSMMWDDSLGLYMDRTIDGRLSTVKSPASFIPMWAGICPADRAERMVNEHLLNESEFWTEMPFPMVSKDDPNYNPEDYWKGPTWINIDYFVLNGLKNYGFGEVYEEALSRLFAGMESNPHFMEYYNPETCEGMGAANFGWSASMYLELVME